MGNAEAVKSGFKFFQPVLARRNVPEVQKQIRCLVVVLRLLRSGKILRPLPQLWLPL